MAPAPTAGKHCRQPLAARTVFALPARVVGAVRWGCAGRTSQALLARASPGWGGVLCTQHLCTQHLCTQHLYIQHLSEVRTGGPAREVWEDSRGNLLGRNFHLVFVKSTLPALSSLYRVLSARTFLPRRGHRAGGHRAGFIVSFYRLFVSSSGFPAPAPSFLSLFSTQALAAVTAPAQGSTAGPAAPSPRGLRPAPWWLGC